MLGFRFGLEAGVAVGLFVVIVPLLQLKGASLRHTFSVHR